MGTPKGEIIESGLAFPEGPVVVGDDIYFVEYGAGRVSRWTAEDGVRSVAHPGGRPNGAALGPNGALYVAQSGRDEVPPAILRMALDGAFAAIADTVGCVPLVAPCDVAFNRLPFSDAFDRNDSRTVSPS